MDSLRDPADPDAGYWTERWLRGGFGGLDPINGRPLDRRARDQAEIAIVRTPHLPPSGMVRTQILARRAGAEARLSELDALLRETFEQRRRLTDRIERCAIALRGLGHQFDERRERYRGMRRVAWRDEQDELIAERLRVVGASTNPASANPASTNPASTNGVSTSGGSPSGCPGTHPTVLTGASLRRKAEELLRVLEVPVTPAELVDLLRLDGITVAGRPSQTLTNALRVSTARGDVERTGRGRYRWVPSRAAA